MHKKAKLKQLSIEVQAQIEILIKDDNSREQITSKLNISRHKVQYSVTKAVRNREHVDKKRIGASSMTTAVEDNHLIVESKRQK